MTEIESIIKEPVEKYQFLINNIIDVITEIDLDGTFTYISPQVKEIFGYKPKEVIGNPFLSYIHPEDVPLIMETFERTIKGKKLVDIEFRVRHKQSHYIPVFAKGSLVKVNDKVKLVAVLREISERKLTEKKLKESEENFKEITEQSFMGICIIQDSRIKYINKTITRMLGFSSDEIQNWSKKEFINLIHPEDKTLAIKRLHRRQKGLTDEKSDNLYRIFTKTGEIKWMDVSSKIIKFQGEDAVLATLVDVTDREKRELKIKESEEKFRTITEQSLMGICIAQDNQIKYINQFYADIFGYTVEEMKNWELKDVINAIHPDDREFALKQLAKKQRGEKDITIHYQYRGVKKSGEIIWVENYSKSIEYDGRPADLVTLINRTEKKEAEERLKESEEKYRMIFNGANDPIAILDGEIMIDVNEITVELFGYENKDEIIGNPPWKLSPKVQPDGKDSIQKARAVIQKAISGESQRFYWKHMKKDGTLFDAEISLSSFKLENKIYIMAIIRDITELKKAERELREISQLKTELLERTSHELKTPLISIKGFTDLLFDLYKDKFNSDIISILEEIKLGTEQLETIINRLLKTSLLESGMIQFKPNNEDLSFLIRFCIKNLRGLAKMRNLFINLDIPDKLILNFEKERIYEVITHLIINAIKYTPPYGEIKIQTKHAKDYVIVSVQDNGIGLSEDEQKKLFKQFGKIERYGQGWDIDTEGTGMGLYTAKKIVELHGGEIWVESEGRNKGAKFCFSLPINKN